MTNSWNSAGMQNKSCTTSFELYARRWARRREDMWMAFTDSQTWPRRQQMISTRNTAISWWERSGSPRVFDFRFPVCHASPVFRVRLWCINALVAPRHRLESRNSWHRCSDSLIFDTTQCLQMWHFWALSFAVIGLYLFTKSVHLSCLVILVD